MGKLRMLAACEMSGRVADAFARRGWEAHSADLLPSELPDTDYRDVISVLSDSASGTHGSYRHRQCDVRDLFSWDHPVNARRQDLAHMTGLDLPLWDLVVAFPPCTHLSLAGARYWKEKRADGRQDEAADFFLEMLQAPAPHIAVENPRGDMTRRYRPPDQYVQPWWFGDPLFKATGLWLRDLPLLKATHTLEDYADLSRVTTGGGSHRTDMRKNGRSSNGHEDAEGRARRQVVRNRTLPGLAAAMAGQWGGYLEELHGR